MIIITIHHLHQLVATPNLIIIIIVLILRIETIQNTEMSTQKNPMKRKKKIHQNLFHHRNNNINLSHNNFNKMNYSQTHYYKIFLSVQIKRTNFLSS